MLFKRGKGIITEPEIKQEIIPVPIVEPEQLKKKRGRPKLPPPAIYRRNTLSITQQAVLHKLYYEEAMTFGRDRLYDYVRRKFPDSHISRRQVMNLLKKQEAHQLYQPAYTTKNIKHTVLSKPHIQIGIDLADLQTIAYDGHNYILACIDLFSKKAYARPLKNKEAKTVAAAMKDILKKDTNGKIESVRSDQGSEFIANEFRKMLKKENVKQVLSLPGKPQSNGNIERFNKTLKQQLAKNMKIRKTRDWVSILPEVIANYNETINSTTGKTPNALDAEEDIEELAQTKQTIHNAVVPKNDKHKDIGEKLRVGYTVRRKLEEDDKGLGGENWSRELYTIYKVIRPRSAASSSAYFIKSEDGTEDKKRYYDNDLQKIEGIENPLGNEKEYTVSKLIKPLMYQKKPAYRVRWKGFKPADDTTEPRDKLQIDIPKMLKMWEKKHDVKWVPVKKPIRALWTS